MQRLAITFFAASLLLAGAPSLALAQAPAAVTAGSLKASLSTVVKGIAPTASSDVFEAQMAGVIEQSGADADIAINALMALKADGGLSANANTAIDALIEALKAKRALRVRSIDPGGKAAVGGAPSFSGGGGGSDYSGD